MKSKKINPIMGIVGYLSEPDGRINESNNQLVANTLKPPELETLHLCAPILEDIFVNIFFS